jgi:hypothetical protein
MILASERAKAVHALDFSAIMTGQITISVAKFYKFLLMPFMHSCALQRRNVGLFIISGAFSTQFSMVTYLATLVSNSYHLTMNDQKITNNELEEM